MAEARRDRSSAWSIVLAAIVVVLLGMVGWLAFYWLSESRTARIAVNLPPPVSHLARPPAGPSSPPPPYPSPPTS